MSYQDLAPRTEDVGITDLLETPEVRDHFDDQDQPVDAVSTPFPTWNRHCRDDGGGEGLARGWHVTIAGNTGYGKSLLALNMAARAIEAGEQVGFLSIEMSKAQVATRLYAMLTGTDVRHLERGPDFDPGTAKDVERQVAEIREQTGGGFVVNEAPVFDVDRAQGLLRSMWETAGTRFVVTDYLQLLGAKDADSLFRQVTEVSARIREFAKTTGVVSVAISQFNRSTSADYETKPRVQGLMASSSIENDSDQVLLLDHTRYEKDVDRGARTWAILGKNRHGGSGEIPIEWDYRDLTVREARPDEEHRWPGAS